MALSQRRGQLLGRLRHRKTREREGLVLVEGVRAVGEALAAGAEARFACVSPRLDEVGGGTSLRSSLEASGLDVATVADAELAELSDTEHPQGVLLVCAQPTYEPPEPAPTAEARYLVLDAVQDPGNVGTLVRAAVAFALDGVLALDGTADPWGAKAVRASAGMVFRLPVYGVEGTRAVALLHRAGIELLVAAADGDDVLEVRSRGAPGGWALVVGNEGAGVREAVRAAGRMVAIRMAGPAESLNAGVAGAILLHALTRSLAGPSGPAEEEGSD